VAKGSWQAVKAPGFDPMVDPMVFLTQERGMGTKQIRAMVAGAEVVEGHVPARRGEPQPLGSQGLPTGAVNGQQVVQARAGAAQKGLRLQLASDEWFRVPQQLQHHPGQRGVPHVRAGKLTRRALT
jgi:hypothetical protein